MTATDDRFLEACLRVEITELMGDVRLVDMTPEEAVALIAVLSGAQKRMRRESASNQPSWWSRLRGTE